MASRVLPMPPAPVRVTRRTRESASVTSAISDPRPTKLVSWSGRFVRFPGSESGSFAMAMGNPHARPHAGRFREAQAHRWLSRLDDCIMGLASAALRGVPLDERTGNMGSRCSVGIAVRRDL
jgi:hypothetical protein